MACSGELIRCEACRCTHPADFACDGDGLKRNEVLSFDDGLLTVRMSGHGRADGWGEIAFHERQIEIDPDGFHRAEIPPSELRALRDFLNRVLPA
jgi:hypothetical protein